MTRWSAIAATVQLAGCSGGDADHTMPTADAAFGVPTCSLTQGRTYTMQQIGFNPAGTGFDLDGDGDIDNALGFLAPVANQVIRDAVDSGFSRHLFHIDGWDNAPADDDALRMIFFAGVDADQPPDLANDFTGQGKFFVTSRDFDVNCNPQHVSRAGRTSNRVLDLDADRWGLFVRNVGTVEFRNVVLRLNIAADMASAGGVMGGVMTSCGLSRAYQPQLGAGTFLDLVLADGRQADIDVDGDGLETIGYTAGQVTGCVDGDGTEIAGASCACDPRVADGYSLSVFAQGVSCEILGVLEAD